MEFKKKHNFRKIKDISRKMFPWMISYMTVHYEHCPVEMCPLCMYVDHLMELNSKMKIETKEGEEYVQKRLREIGTTGR